MACSNREAVKLAGRLGLAVLCFSFLPPGEVRGWMEDYYAAIKSECVPIGHTVNASFAIAEPLALDRDGEAAYQCALPHRLFFATGVAHYYVAGVDNPRAHRPLAALRGRARAPRGGGAPPATELHRQPRRGARGDPDAAGGGRRPGDARRPGRAYQPR